MARKTLVRIIVVAVIAVVLGSASFIIATNRAGPVADAPSGFFH